VYVAPPFAAAVRTAPFGSPQCLHALYQVLASLSDFSVHTVGDNSQLHTSILSYYRALLLKERVRDTMVSVSVSVSVEAVRCTVPASDALPWLMESTPLSYLSLCVLR
jgi:hypothetical protein